MLTADVVIVGAGPVGTVAAYVLAEKGVEVILCETGPGCAQDLRASTFHPPTLEMLDKIGIADEIIDYGLKAPKYHFRERQTGEFIEFDMAEISDHTKYPYRIQCEQHVMAGKLAKRLQAHPNATLLFNHRAVSFSQDDDSVVSAFETPLSIEQIKSKYLIGADGGNSIIRKWLGGEFGGFTYPEKFLCMSTTRELKDYIDDLVYVNYISDPQEWLVLLKVPSVWRILLPADESVDDQVLLSDETCDAVFSRLIGETGVDTAHRTIYRVHQRVVTRFNHGRVFLAGDSAHLNNPIGGFGMNSGIHDAWNLHEKILCCLEKGHDHDLFDLYDRQRRTVTNNFIQAQTIHNKQLLEHSSEMKHTQRFEQMKAIQADPEKRHDFLLRQSMFGSLREANSIS